MINGIGSTTNALLGTQLGGAKGADAAARAGTAARPGQMSASTLMAQMAAEGAPIETDRVAAIRAAIKAGTYTADPEAIAAKMVSLDVEGAVR